MGFPIFQVDAFTRKPFSGNPAAVCLLDGPQDPVWMQNLAAELNLSETAFLIPEADEYRLRWFTPVTEVDLCGHATLAAAHILWEEGRLAANAAARFQTRSGLLQAVRRKEGIALDFPAGSVAPLDPPAALVRGLGAEAVFSGTDGTDYLVEVHSEQILRGLKPDLDLWKTLSVRGIIVTCRSQTPGFDFLSRFFAPGAGIDEDPVTGSAHCTLGPFWAGRLEKTALVAFQASRRGGEIRLTCKPPRVILTGTAITVYRGQLA